LSIANPQPGSLVRRSLDYTSGEASLGFTRNRCLRFVAARVLVVGMIVTMLLAATETPASAAGVVGDGTPDSCTDAAFDAALAGGGAITFNCGPNPLTIGVT